VTGKDLFRILILETDDWVGLKLFFSLLGNATEMVVVDSTDDFSSMFEREKVENVRLGEKDEAKMIRPSESNNARLIRIVDNSGVLKWIGEEMLSLSPERFSFVFVNDLSKIDIVDFSSLMMEKIIAFDDYRSRWIVLMKVRQASVEGIQKANDIVEKLRGKTKELEFPFYNKRLSFKGLKGEGFLFIAASFDFITYFEFHRILIE